MGENENKKTKITHVTRFAHPHIGGIEAVINQINDSLPNEEFDKEVLCCSNTEKSSIENGVKYNRARYWFEVFNNTISLSFLWKLSRVKTDILHYHMPFIFAVICHFIARPKYKKMYITYHSSLNGYEKVMKPFWGVLKSLYNKASKIHILSKNIIDYDAFLKPYENKCVTIPYGIDLNQHYNQGNVEKIKNTYKNKKILLCVGRLMKIKGYQYAIEVMQYIDNAILLIIGDGNYRTELENLINYYNLHEKVFLLGEIRDELIKADYYNACDILLFPSTKDMFGIVQQEAMLHTKPVINTNLGTGVNFVSINNETGLTVEPKNIEQLKNAINTLLGNDEFRHQYGQNAQKRVEDLFDIKKIKKKYINFYNTSSVKQ